MYASLLGSSYECRSDPIPPIVLRISSIPWDSDRSAISSAMMARAQVPGQDLRIRSTTRRVLKGVILPIRLNMATWQLPRFCVWMHTRTGRPPEENCNLDRHKSLRSKLAGMHGQQVVCIPAHIKEYNDSIAAHWIGSYVVVANSKAKDGGSKLFKVDKQGNVDICDSETGDQNVVRTISLP